MADIAGSDVTVVINPLDVSQLSRDGRIVRGSLSCGNGTLTYDPSTGIPLTKGKLGAFFEIKDFIVQKVTKGQDFVLRFDRAAQCLRVYDGVVGEGLSTLTVKDDDCAASNGVALYVLDQAASPNVGEDKFVSRFLAANANNADASFRFGVQGPTVVVEDDNCAASNGVQVYLDENDNKLIAAIAADLYVPLSDGSKLKIYADASAASNGVAVYFDDDAANDYERILAVTAGNADDTVSQEMANGEIAPTLNINFVAHVA